MNFAKLTVGKKTDNEFVAKTYFSDNHELFIFEDSGAFEKKSKTIYSFSISLNEIAKNTLDKKYNRSAYESGFLSPRTAYIRALYLISLYEKMILDDFKDERNYFEDTSE
jgi:hypothetical protein